MRPVLLLAVGFAVAVGGCGRSKVEASSGFDSDEAEPVVQNEPAPKYKVPPLEPASEMLKPDVADEPSRAARQESDCQPIEQKIAKLEGQRRPLAGFCDKFPCDIDQWLAAARAELALCRDPEVSRERKVSPPRQFEDCSRFDDGIRRARQAFRKCRDHCGGKVEAVKQKERAKRLCNQRNFAATR